MIEVLVIIFSMLKTLFQRVWNYFKPTEVSTVQWESSVIKYGATYKPTRPILPMIIPKSTLFLWRDQDADKKRFIGMLFNFSHQNRTNAIVLKRDENEMLDTCVTKMKQKIKQSFSERKKKQQKEDVSGLEVDISFGDSQLSDILVDVVNKSTKASFDRLVYTIVKDCVDISSITCPFFSIAGCMLPLNITYRKDHPEKPPTVFWFVSRGRFKNTDPPFEFFIKETLENGQIESFDVPNFDFRARGATFCPSANDVGRRIFFIADLGPGTIIKCGYCSDLIHPKEQLISAGITNWCKKPVPINAYRLVTYNILADLYLNLSLKQDQLFYPYCPKEYQDHRYRYPFLLNEIREFQSDIIFLQEVDERMRLKYLPLECKAKNMQMIFQKKGRQVSEGTAIIYKKHHFKQLQAKGPMLSDLSKESYNDDVRSLIDQSEECKAIFDSRPTVLQSVVLETKSGDVLVLGNTHLHHKGDHDHIKLFQALVAARYLFKLVESLKNKHKQVRLLFAGDFNSLPDGAVYHIFSKGFIGENHNVWSCDSKLKPQKLDLNPEEPGRKLDNLTGQPPYTNFTSHIHNGVQKGFSGTLDYIWSTDFDVLSSAPEVPHRDVTRHVALPSRIAPSDHLPRVIEVKTRV